MLAFKLGQSSSGSDGYHQDFLLLQITELSSAMALGKPLPSSAMAVGKPLL